MATERVYHPETCEPFDVSTSKAAMLVLEKGWSRSPWERVVVAEEPEVVVIEDEDLHQAEADAEVAASHVPDEPVPGRGRRRRDAVVALDDQVDAATLEVIEVEGDVEPSSPEDEDASWRS